MYGRTFLENQFAIISLETRWIGRYWDYRVYTCMCTNTHACTHTHVHTHTRTEYIPNHWRHLPLTQLLLLPNRLHVQQSYSKMKSDTIREKVHAIRNVQWNLTITLGTNTSGWIIEVAGSQGKF